MKEIDEIRKINEEIQRLRDRREEFMKQAVEKHCPFKVGDELPVTESHRKGKLILTKTVYLEVKNKTSRWVALGLLVNHEDFYGWKHIEKVDENVE